MAEISKSFVYSLINYVTVVKAARRPSNFLQQTNGPYAINVCSQKTIGPFRILIIQTLLRESAVGPTLCRPANIQITAKSWIPG